MMLLNQDPCVLSGVSRARPLSRLLSRPPSSPPSSPHWRALPALALSLGLSGALGSEGAALAQPASPLSARHGSPCAPNSTEPCRPALLEGGVQKSPAVFYLQARVSPAKLPSGRGKVEVFVNISNTSGDVLCRESFSKPAQIREGVLNLEVGRGMDCPLDEVFAENTALRVQLCLGSPTSCMRPIDLTAVPFALSAHVATEVKQARHATLAARADVSHRVTADADVLKPSAVGYGYFDFFTPTPAQRDAFVSGSQGGDGFMLWSPVRGAEEGEVFPANQVLFVGEDTQGEIATLQRVHLVAARARVMGRSRVLSGHAVVRGSAQIEGEARVHQRLSAPQLVVHHSGGADALGVIGDSALIDHLAVSEGVSVRGGATLRARVSAPSTSVSGVARAEQQTATLGAVQARGAVTAQVDRRLEVGGDLSVAGEPLERLNAPPSRRGLEVEGATLVGGEVRVYGTTTVTRRLNPQLPQASGGQGLSLKAEGGSPRRVFSVRESGVVEMNKPAESQAPQIAQVAIQARKVIFEGQATFQEGVLGSECQLDPDGPNFTLTCGAQRLSFASDQCGNGRRFRCACGDGSLNIGEECDDGNESDLDACLSSCSLARCGDRLTRADLLDPSQEGYEACDDGNDDNLDACLGTCLLASCGDGFLRQDLAPSEPGFEECDDGDLNDNNACTNACRPAVCGDGSLRRDLSPGQPGAEECDDGDLAVGDGCDALCVREICGNGALQAGEACDDGNTNSSDACVECRHARCGDGAVRAGVEACDDGNDRSDDACVRCQPARCGDGAVFAGVERCDDGNADPYDVCRNDCTPHCAQIDKVAHFVNQGGSVAINTRGRRSSPTSSGGGGPQAAVGVTVSQRQTVIFESIDQDYDAYYHLRGACDDAAHIASDDDSGGSLRPRIERTLDPGTYYLIADGYARSSGASTLRVSMLGCSAVPIAGEINLTYGQLWFWSFLNGYAAGQLTVNTAGGERVNLRQCGGDGPQKAIAFTLTRTSSVRFTTISGQDPVLHIRSSLSCHNPQDITCDDDGGPGLNSHIQTTLSAGTYYLIVDGYGGRSGQVTVDYEIR
jgi:cysteine-rich repeat protein